jgi:SAM-dependent methyltransferase
MTATKPLEAIRDDFDRIALLPDDPADHNRRYHDVLTAELPARIESALEVGCGSGEFTRVLGERARRVLALDLSPRMIEAARERGAAQPHVEYRVADALTWPAPEGAFDCIASIATLHHLPLREMLAKLRTALAPGGVLLVLDLVSDASPLDTLRSALAVPVNLANRLVRTGRLRASPEHRAAWDAHGRDERYASLPEVRAVAREVLPGARVRRHLLWRYSLVFRKPA